MSTTNPNSSWQPVNPYFQASKKRDVTTNFKDDVIEVCGAKKCKFTKNIRKTIERNSKQQMIF
jgi:hypothetical protein